MNERVRLTFKLPPLITNVAAFFFFGVPLIDFNWDGFDLFADEVDWLR